MNENKYKKITDYLNACIEKNMLSHAYIFYGPDKDAENKMAFGFANKILKNNDSRLAGDQVKFHPDLLSIKPELDEEISINLIRQIKNFLMLRPYSGEHKIVIIESAEKLNSYSQNSLLKTLEEAPGHAVIILCVKTLDSISDTIASRAVKLPFWQIQSEPAPYDKNSEIFEGLLNPISLNKYGLIEKFGKQSASDIFKNWIDFLRTKFKNKPTKEMAGLLKESQNIYFKLNETNINQKFAYDDLILNLLKWKI